MHLTTCEMPSAARGPNKYGLDHSDHAVWRPTIGGLRPLRVQLRISLKANRNLALPDRWHKWRLSSWPWQLLASGNTSNGGSSFACLNPVARLFHIRGPYGVLVLSGGFLGLIGVILGTVAIVRKGWAKYALLGTCAGGLAIAACFVMRMSFLPELYESKRHFLKHNPDMVFTKDGEGMTPLHRAAMRGQKDIAELLLANRADVNAKDDHGWTPLQETAVWYSQDAEQERAQGWCGRSSAAHGADVDARDHEGKTPLHNAASTGKKELAQLLLTGNADVNALSDRGETPLHLAAQCGSKDVVALLLANRADVNAKDKDGATPLDYAAKSSRQEVVELLVANKAEVANIYDAAACGDLDRIMKFIGRS